MSIVSASIRRKPASRTLTLGSASTEATVIIGLAYDLVPCRLVVQLPQLRGRGEQFDVFAGHLGKKGGLYYSQVSLFQVEIVVSVGSGAVTNEAPFLLEIDALVDALYLVFGVRWYAGHSSNGDDVIRRETFSERVILKVWGCLLSRHIKSSDRVSRTC